MNYKILIILLLSFVSCKNESTTKTLNVSHGLQRTHPVYKGTVVFKETLEKISNGKIKVNIYPDGQLGNDRETLELLQIGSIDVTVVSSATLSNFVPDYKVLGIPYLFKSKDHYFNILEGEIGKSLLIKGSNYWLRGLSFYDAGSRSFYTKNKAIRTPEDLKGLKIRVMNNQMSINMVNTLGGSATPMSFGEVYIAIQQGVVDGAENNPPSFVSTNHYEVSKYYTLDEHSSVPDVLIIGTKYWDKLSKEEQKWVQEAATISAQAEKKFWETSVKESLDKVKASGVEIIIPDKSLFTEQSKSVLDNFLKDNPEMVSLVEKIKLEGGNLK